ncbi:sugar ABC transporter substrate-binding protein [Bacteroidota bacterium]
MKKLIYTFIIIFSFGLFLIGCNSKEMVKVGISLGPVHERWSKDRDFLIKHLESNDVKVYVEEAQGSQKRQNDQIVELVNKKIDVLIIIPVNSEEASSTVNYAKKEGVKVIAYDRIVRNCDLDYYVSFDNVKVGEQQAEYLTKIKPEGNYVILGGAPTDNNSMLLKLGQMNILQPLIIRGDIQVVLDQYVENWDSEVAYEILNDFLNKNTLQIDAIVASNDAISRGAYKALAEHRLSGKVLLSGQDAEIDACKRIVNGNQTMTVYKVIESLAFTTANLAIDLARDNKMPNTQTTTNNGQKMVPAILLQSIMPVTKENIRMTVIADGYLDEEEIFGN